MLFLLDASAVLNDFSFEFKKTHSYFTTNPILQEFRDIRSRNLADNAIKKGTLKIADPSTLLLKKAASIANSLEQRMLSEADLSILALAMELKERDERFILITDDHSLQFICRELKMPFQAIIRGKIRKWKKPKKQGKKG